MEKGRPIARTPALARGLFLPESPAGGANGLHYLGSRLKKKTDPKPLFITLISIVLIEGKIQYMGKIKECSRTFLGGLTNGHG